MKLIITIINIIGINIIISAVPQPSQVRGCTVTMLHVAVEMIRTVTAAEPANSSKLTSCCQVLLHTI